MRFMFLLSNSVTLKRADVSGRDSLCLLRSASTSEMMIQS